MTAGIVLAGGKSTRMGTSKASLPFGDETMLQRVVRILGGLVHPIVVVAAAGQDLPPLPADVIITRDEREGRGPLEGLRAGLKALPPEAERAYVTSCDVPLLVPSFVSEMLALAEGHDAAVMEIDGFTHPLSAVYSRATLSHVEDLLAHERLRPVFLYERVDTRRVRPVELKSDPELRSLRNLNTPDDYQAALKEVLMTSDEQAIREVVDTWMRASRAGDTATVLSLMTDDVVFMTPGREPFGKDVFRSQSGAMEGVQIDGRAEIVELKVLGDWAYLRNHIDLTITPPGGTPQKRAGYTLTLLQKQADGRWLLARDANLVT